MTDSFCVQGKRPITNYGQSAQSTHTWICQLSAKPHLPLNPAEGSDLRPPL